MVDRQHLCRVCLQNHAHIPIFQEDETTLFSKLFLCLHEKIEDIEGYPKNLCSQCSNELDIACAFINKFQETSSILANAHMIFKQEKVKCKDELSDNDNFSEIEIDTTDLCKLDLTPNNEQLISYFDLNDKLPKVNKKLRHLKTKKQQTNFIASSILEKVFTWDGESWSPDLTKRQRKRTVQRKPLMKQKKVDKIKKSPENKEKLCSFCGEVLKNAERLSAHIKRKHLTDRIECPMCSKVCSTKHDLKRHQKNKHSIEKNFVCSTCGKRFVLKHILTQHMFKVHSKDYVKKVFNCAHCPKTYSCQKSVTIHERSVHTGLRPAVCSVCQSAFYHVEYLKEHMRLHTGETPFKCPVCGRGYAQRGNMKSHLRIHRRSELDTNTLSKLKPSLLKLMKE